MKAITIAAILVAAMTVAAGCRAAPAEGAGDEILELRLRVAAPAGICAGTPVCAPIELPAALSEVAEHEIRVRLQPEEGGVQGCRGQVVRRPDGGAEVWWIMPKIEKGKSFVWKAILEKGGPGSGPVFTCGGTEGAYRDMVFGDRTMLRYMYAYDPSTPERLHETYKVYHHVFDPAGKQPITKGPGGLYTHHRGLYIGWNKLGHGDRTDDFWHMKGVTQRHVKFLAETGGPVMARTTALINWTAGNGGVVIAEERTVTVYRQPAPASKLIDFHTRLTAKGGDVVLDGDPEHAGFQFRAHNGIAEGEAAVKAAYVFHTDGIDPRKDLDLPWAAMTFGPKGARYTVLYMLHPDNPGPAVYSAYRDYGRFGSYFKGRIAAGETLELRYRVAVTEDGPPPRDEMECQYGAFAEAPAVTVLDGR